MPYTIPNRVNAGFDPQARPFQQDFEILAQSAALTGVKTGCVVTAQGSPNMTVAVSAGSIYYLNLEVAVASGNVTITTAHATLPRIDMVVVNTSGVKSAVVGTAGATPLPPAIPATSVVLAFVYVPAADTTIASNQITSKGVTVQIPSVAGGTQIVRKTTDESVTSSTVMQNDNHLFFNMTTNGRWRFKFTLMVLQLITNNSMKMNFVAPAGAVWRAMSAIGTAHASDGNATDFTLVTSQSVLMTTIEGVVTTGANSGNFQLQWAQWAADANSMTMLTNSFLEYAAL